MRFLILIICWTTSLLAQAKSDVLIKSRFDLNSSRSFIDQLRSVLIRNNFGDPYNQVFDRKIEVDLASVLGEMPRDTQKWILELQNLLKLQIFNSEYRLVAEGLGYRIEDFNSQFSPLPSRNSPRVEYVTHNYVQSLTLEAKRIAFEVLLKKTQNGDPITFKIELVKPKFHVSPQLVMDLPMGWSTILDPDNLLITLHSINLETIIEAMVAQPDLIDLDMEDLLLPEVSVRVGRKEIKFDNEKIEKFLNKNKRSFKLGILELLKTRLNGKFANVLKDNPLNFSVPRTFEINNHIHAILKLQDVTANNSGILQFAMDGTFCRVNTKAFLKTCPKGEVFVKPPRRTIDQNTSDRSSRFLNREIIETSSNLAFSISEDFLNRLVEATIEAGLWEGILGEDVELGPESAFVLADEKGPTLSLYLDIIYHLKGAQRVLVGRSQLRFPVRLKISLLTEVVNEIPYFRIKVSEVATTEEMVLKGLPHLKLVSTVGNVPRFRKKVLKSVLEDVSEFGNKTLVDLDLPELKGTVIEQLQFSSDGMGRANATFNF